MKVTFARGFSPLRATHPAPLLEALGCSARKEATRLAFGV